MVGEGHLLSQVNTAGESGFLGGLFSVLSEVGSYKGRGCLVSRQSLKNGSYWPPKAGGGRGIGGGIKVCFGRRFEAVVSRAVTDLRDVKSLFNGNDRKTFSEKKW